GSIGALRFVRRIVFEGSIAPKSRTQTDLESHPLLATPAFSAHVYCERRLSRRPRRVRLLRQHGLVRISNPRENARASKTADYARVADQSIGAARRANQLPERA